MSTTSAVVASLLVLGTAWLYSSKYRIYQCQANFKSLEYRPLDGRFEFSDSHFNTLLQWKEVTPQKSRSLSSCDSHTLAGSHCFIKSETVKIELLHIQEHDAECFRVKYTALTRSVYPGVCFDLSGAHWYGAAAAFHQHWPMNQQQMPMQPFVSNDVLDQSRHAEFKWGSVVERYWVSSRGIGIIVDNSVPLHVSFNENGDQKMCFIADNSTQPYTGHSKQNADLDFIVCRSIKENVKNIHRYLYRKKFKLPSGLPDTRMIKSPIWSTWARYKVFINETKTLQYAQEIVDHGFSNSQIEIDDMFTTAYGEIDFDPQKFPHPKEMVTALHGMGFRVTVWVHPFANIDSNAFLEGSRQGYWVMDETSNVPALIRWWQGTGAILDVTNEEAVNWYIERLRTFQENTGVHSFKFDAGEIVYLPPNFRTKVPLSDPSEYTTKYVTAVAALGTQIEVRAGYQSQNLPIFVRMFDKDSKWGYDNGLKTMIPTALTMGVLGYPFILPDMIGGNAYGDWNFSATVLPERELFIRWVQLSAYLPSMQFSIAPWDYDEEVTLISQRMVKTHEEVVTPLLLAAAEESIKKGIFNNFSHQASLTRQACVVSAIGGGVKL